MNLLNAPLTEGGATLAGAVIPLSPGIRAAAARDKLTELVVGIRPEHMHLTDVAGTAAEAGADRPAATGASLASPVLASPVLHGEVLLVEELGADALLHVRLVGDGGPVVGGPVVGGPVVGSTVVGSTVVARTEGRKSPAPGQSVAFRVQPDDVFAFHPVTGARLAG
jgi:multiple sugar transport system ATP-binding protein